MYKAKSLSDIQDMLDALPAPEFRFDSVREDDLTLAGALRTLKGQNIIEPAAESASMIIGLKASIRFLEAAPMIVKQLLDELKDQKPAKKTEQD